MTFGEAAKTSARRRPVREYSDDIEAPEVAPALPCDPEDTPEEEPVEQASRRGINTSFTTSVAVKKLQRKKREQVLSCVRAQAREHAHMRSVGGKARGTVFFCPVSRGARYFSRES